MNNGRVQLNWGNALEKPTFHGYPGCSQVTLPCYSARPIYDVCLLLMSSILVSVCIQPGLAPEWRKWVLHCFEFYFPWFLFILPPPPQHRLSFPALEYFKLWQIFKALVISSFLHWCLLSWCPRGCSRHISPLTMLPLCLYCQSLFFHAHFQSNLPVNWNLSFLFKVATAILFFYPNQSFSFSAMYPGYHPILFFSFLFFPRSFPTHETYFFQPQ